MHCPSLLRVLIATFMGFVASVCTGHTPAPEFAESQEWFDRFQAPAATGAPLLPYDLLRREIAAWREYAPAYFGDFYPESGLPVAVPTRPAALLLTHVSLP